MIKIKYRRLVVEVDVERPQLCSCCLRKMPKIDFHHYKYAFKTSEVRLDPSLALLNGDFLCYPCHQVADALRIVESHKETVGKLQDLIFDGELIS